MDITGLAIRDYTNFMSFYSHSSTGRGYKPTNYTAECLQACSCAHALSILQRWDHNQHFIWDRSLNLDNRWCFASVRVSKTTKSPSKLDDMTFPSKRTTRNQDLVNNSSCQIKTYQNWLHLILLIMSGKKMSGVFYSLTSYFLFLKTILAEVCARQIWTCKHWPIALKLKVTRTL